MARFLTDLAEFAFLQHAVLAALLVSVASGVIGTFVVVRRITYIAGGVAHCVLGGMGAARYLERVHGVEGLHPMHGAVAAALLAAMIIGLTSLRAREREDTVIGALWAVGMAAGVLFIAATPGYSEDLMGFLFGNILMVTRGDLFLIGGLDLVILAAMALLYKQFFAVSFDEEFARLRGVRTDLFYLALLGLTALTVVLLVTVVGIVMVIALLTLPVATAGRFSRGLGQMMLLSVILSALLSLSGIALSYDPNLPPGAVIVLLAGAVYLVVTVGHAVLRGRKAGG